MLDTPFPRHGILKFDGLALPLVEIDGVPHLAAADLGLALELERPEDDVLSIYRRRSGEFVGTASVRAALDTPAGPRHARLFGPLGAYIVADHVETPAARRFRRSLLEWLATEAFGSAERLRRLDSETRSLRVRVEALEKALRERDELTRRLKAELDELARALGKRRDSEERALELFLDGEFRRLSEEMDERHAAGMKKLAEAIGVLRSAPARPPAFPSDGLIPVGMGEIGGRACAVVDANDLHAFLGVGKDFSTWIKARIDEYGFEENQDVKIDSPILGNQTGRGGDRRSKKYLLSLDMAKELAMVERNDKGRRIRRYFIECERLALEGAWPPPAPETAQPAQFPAAPLPPERRYTLDDRLYLSFQEIVRGEVRRTPHGRLTNAVSLNDAKLLAHVCRHAPESGHVAQNWRDFERQAGIPRRGLKRALGNLTAMGYLEPAVERRGEGIFCRIRRNEIRAALDKAGLAWPEGEAFGGPKEETP